MVNAVQKAAYLVIALTIAGCSGESEAPEAPPSVFGDTNPLSVASVEVDNFGIGDVETSLKVVLTVDTKTEQPNVSYQEFLTRKKEIAKVEVHVSKPYPEKLFLRLAIRSFDDFTGHAVQVLPHMYIDGENVLSYGFLYGNNARVNRYEYPFEIMTHLDEIPERILVHTETEVNLFMDTDESDITINTPRANERNTTRMLTSPVIIFFD